MCIMVLYREIKGERKMTEVSPKIVGLTESSVDDGRDVYDFLLLNDEIVEKSYKSIRDRLIFTNKRVIVIDLQGLTNKKREYMTIPYSKISSFSCESGGNFDIDAELKIWAFGFGKTWFQFSRDTDIRTLAKLISMYVCK